MGVYHDTTIRVEKMTSYKILAGGPKCLGRFVSLGDSRLASAFVQGGTAWATDGCIAVWGRGSILATYTKMAGEIIEPSAGTVERGDEVESPDMECMAGQYRFNGEKTAVWPKKDVILSDGYDYERIGNRHIRRDYARKIRGLGRVVFFTGGEAEDPICFENDEIRGVIMPLSQEVAK